MHLKVTGKNAMLLRVCGTRV